MLSRSRSPSSSSKRIKLEVPLLPNNNGLEGIEISQPEEPDQEDSENGCSICLHSIADRTVIPKCSHEFCFECLLVWTEQSRRCPLCSQAIGEYLIHSIRSRYDYRKHYLPPLRTSPLPSRPAHTNIVLQNTRQRRRREREWGIRARESDEADKLERSIAKRRWIYRHDLYSKHVASNSYTKYRPYPTPAQFATSQDLISRTTTFLRRELQIWEGLDVEFLTTLIISLMKSIDIRSESAVKLISEFLDIDAPYTPGGRHMNAEHFAHEVYSYVRSPYKDLFVYDTVVQYDTPSHLPQPIDIERSYRWHEPSPIWPQNEPSADGHYGSQSGSRSKSSERSTSWSPTERESPAGTGGSGHRRTSMSKRNRRPSGDISKSWDKSSQNANSGHIGGQNNLGDVSQALVASFKREKEMPIFSKERDVKGKRKADEIGMTTFLTDGPNSKIVGVSLVEPPMMTEKDDEPDQPRNMKPSRTFRVPRNLTLLDSVRAHLAVPEERGRQNRADYSSTNQQPSSSIFFQTSHPVPSLLTRLSDPPYVPTANSTKARSMSGDCQQNAGDNERHWKQNISYRDIDNSPNTGYTGGQQLRSQDSTQSGPNRSTAEKEKLPTSSKDSYVSVPNVINQSLPLESTRSIVCQNSTATSTSVEDNAMVKPFYQRRTSRSLPILSSSQGQVDNDSPPNPQQVPHVQPPPRSSFDAVGLDSPNQYRPLAHSTPLNPVDTRTKLLARLEIEKQQVIRMDDCSPQSPEGSILCPSFFISRKSHPFDRDAPLKPHEREPDVLDLASDPLVSEELRDRESKLRARAQLRVRLAAEKRLGS